MRTCTAALFNCGEVLGGYAYRVESFEPPRPSLRSSLGPDLQLTERGGVAGIFRSYVWQNLAITVWFTAPDMASLAIFEQRSRAFCTKHPEGFSSVHILVPGGRAMPSSEVRAELSRVIHESAPFVAAAAALIAGTGFWASAVRGMVTALTLLTPHSLAPRIYADIEPLAEWLVPLHTARTGVHMETGEVQRALWLVQRAVMRATA